MRILLIEDDPMIGRGLCQALQDGGISVDWVRDGINGSEAMAVGTYALVLLDLGLPGRAGTEILRMARNAGDKTPVLVITARDELDDRVAGLDLGADDYLVKPFELRELMARIRAVVRRQVGQAVSVVGNGEIELDLASHEASYRGQTHMLPAREFALIRALLERPGTILSRSQLEEKIYADPSNRANVGHLLAPEFWEVSPSGEKVTRAMVLERLAANPMIVDSYPRDDTKIEVYGDVAISTGRATLKGRLPLPDGTEKAIVRSNRYAHVWIRRDGVWQTVFAQNSNTD